VHMTQWPSRNQLHLDCLVATDDTTVHMLGLQEDKEAENEHATSNTRTRIVAMSPKNGGVDIMIEPLTPDRVPSQHAWVLVLTGISNLNQANPEFS